MKQRPLHELTRVARVDTAPEPSCPRLSRRQRLERWAAVLERHRGELQSLHGTEYQSRSTRAAMRADNSPLTVAFDDPVLRAEGLKSDRLGDAERFFGLSAREAHEILCYCHAGWSMSPRVASIRVHEVLRVRRANYRLAAGMTGTLGVVALAVALL